MRAATVLLLLATSGEARSQASAEGASVRRDTVTVEADRQESLQDRNKQLARDFYRELWFTDGPDGYDRYLSDDYIVHDIRDRQGGMEPAVEKRNIAEFLRPPGNVSGGVDFQVAEGDLVATLWRWDLGPTSRISRVMDERRPVPILNVLRFEDGKVVEIWNHRLMADTGVADFRLLMGLGFGLLLALPGWVFFFRERRKRRSVPRDPDQHSWQIS